jgi:hypothetical protein
MSGSPTAGPHWEARIPHDGGEAVINRYELRALLDALERQVSAHQAVDGAR